MSAAPAAAGQGPPIQRDGELVFRGGGQVIQGWTGVSVTRGIERMPSDFDVTASVRAPGQSPVPLGTAVVLEIGGHAVLTGYLERRIERLDGDSHVMNFVGRGRCCDLVDTAALVDNQGLTATKISDLTSRLLAPYAGPINAVLLDGEGDGKPYRYDVNLGESPYEIIERIARFQGLLVYEGADGNLVLARVGKHRHASGFVEGKNVQAAEFYAAKDERFDRYIPLLMSHETITRDGSLPGGQAAAGAIVYDADIKRYRPRVIVSDQNIGDTFLAGQRAVWEKNRRVGRSTRISLMADSWLDAAGVPWTPNSLATVAFPSMGIGETPLLITEVSYRRDGSSGTTASITLTLPDAMSIEPTLLNATVARALTPRATPTGDPAAPAPATTAPNAAAAPERGAGRTGL